MSRYSKFLSILAVAFALAFSMALVGCGQQASSSAASSSTSASASASASTDAEVTYTLTIDASEANLGILYDQSGTTKAGTTVYDALTNAGLPLAVDLSSGCADVYGIGNAIVNDDKAGWTFSVNGEMATVTSDQMQIADGDTIEWKYHADVSEVL